MSKYPTLTGPQNRYLKKSAQSTKKCGETHGHLSQK